MKKTLFINLLIVGVLFSACTKDITGLNVNPKSPTTGVPSATVFLQGEKSLVDVMTTTAVGVSPFRVLAQNWTENTYTYEAIYNLSAYASPNGFWNYIYTGPAPSPGITPPGTGVLNNLKAAKSLFASDVVDLQERRNDYIITDILAIYANYLLVSTYGNIPYSQAEQDSIPFPKYDDARTVYNDLLTRIDTCIANMNLSGGSSLAADQIYGGDPAKWVKFAASLKLKMAMLLADVDPTTAAKKVQEALATGVFTSNDDNALFKYDRSSPLNSNPIWNALVYGGRHDFVPTAFMVNTMDSLLDPRVPLYFTTAPDTTIYTGGIPGKGNGYGIYSDFTPTIQAADYKGDILDYSEIQFLLAEAAARGFAGLASADSYYNSAITASIQFWGGSATDAANYLAQPSVAYATAGGGDWHQAIGYQSWIALYNGNWNAWTSIRRLKVPNVDVLDPPVGAKGRMMPLRFTYPTNEQTSNSINWNAAASLLPGGQDVVSAKLFWMQ